MSSFRKDKVDLSLDEIIKQGKPVKMGAGGRGGKKFQRGPKTQIGRSFPSKVGRGGRIGKRGAAGSGGFRVNANTGKKNRLSLNPNTKKLVEELALKTVNRVLASRSAPRITTMQRGATRGNRIASILSRRRFLQRPVQVVEEVFDEESDEDEYEEVPGPSTTLQPLRTFPEKNVRKQVVIKRVAARPLPTKKQVVVQRIVGRQVPSRIQQRVLIQRKGQFQRQQNKVLNVPPGNRAMNMKNGRMFSALFGPQRSKEGRMNSGSNFLDRLPNVQRKGRGFSDKYSDDY